MTQADRKTAATAFRRYIQRSNELHAAYLTDPELLDNYDRFTRWQFDYLLPRFEDLHANDGYTAAIDFVMSDLAGVGISDRDRDLERVAGLITTMLPIQALRSIAAAAELNARVLQVNLEICRCLLIDGRLPERITERDYCLACREASSLEECVELVHLITDLGETLKSLVRMPMISFTLKAMNRPAHMAGFAALQDFLESGYYTFRDIPDIDHFLQQIRTRMTEIFTRIYTEPLDRLNC
ncbi:MAG: hypothetical protein OEV63_13060 [Gammaproteobacteria bacterium]|nr:hypothetical protein [Gammaproteobacteria bacterium]MDH5502179.1 hypothetical protein [Gammaproteobacteria bacterium]